MVITSKIDFYAEKDTLFIRVFPSVSFGVGNVLFKTLIKLKSLGKN